MAEIGEIKVPVDFQITDTSRTLIKRLVAETMREAIEGEKIAFLPGAALRQAGEFEDIRVTNQISRGEGFGAVFGQSVHSLLVARERQSLVKQ